MLSTPAGRDGQSARSSASRALTRAVCAAIFITTVQPAASAGAKDRTASTTGEFHGTITPATPIGSDSSIEYTPSRTRPPRPVSVRACAA
ncbi:hypothetical protein P9209_06755 [Prescottella defluvii]|nr:hypothetical protein P9209_06755 [Prescottella defluvii]